MSRTGDTTAQLYESSKKAVFGGVGGNVVIDTADVSTMNGIQFDSDQYIISATNAHKLTLGGTAPKISVATKDHRATISVELAGVNGFNKLGAGTLRLDADNSYIGTTTITAGVLKITSDRSLGATSAGVALNGGTLKTSGNIALHVARTITGSGTLDVAASSTLLTVNGVVNPTPHPYGRRHSAVERPLVHTLRPHLWVRCDTRRQRHSTDQWKHDGIASGGYFNDHRPLWISEHSQRRAAIAS